MKIGLINPAYSYAADPSNPDILSLPGTVYIGASLKKQGYDVKVADFVNNPSASLNDVADCDIVGIATFINCYGFLKNSLPELKKSGKTIVVGGPLVSSYGLSQSNLLMNVFPEIDYAVIGEGEKTICELIQHIENNNKLPQGVIKRNLNTLIATEPRKISDMAELPELDYSDWLHLAKSIENRSTFTISTSRGCYNQCSFCFKPYKGVRFDSLAKVEKNLKETAKLKPREISFCDDVFTYNKERAIAVGKIAKQFNLPYQIMARVTDVDKSLLSALKETGCTRIKYGIESFDEKVIKLAGKNITKKQVYKAIQITRESGMDMLGFFLIGLPGETKKSIESTIAGIKETKIKPRSRLVVPLPGTRLYKQALEQNLFDEVELFKQFSESNAESAEGNWIPVNLTTSLSDEELIEARDRLHELRKELDAM